MFKRTSGCGEGSAPRTQILSHHPRRDELDSLMTPKPDDEHFEELKSAAGMVRSVRRSAIDRDGNADIDGAERGPEEP